MSAAAIGTDGQLTTFCYGPTGPCRRCVFPSYEEVEACDRCEDVGVLGPVVGVMGSAAALEAMKIAGRLKPALDGRLWVADLFSMTFRTVALRRRREACVGCGSAQTQDTEPVSVQPTAVSIHQSSEHPLRENRLSPAQVLGLIEKGQDILFIDVRPANQYLSASLRVDTCEIRNVELASLVSAKDGAQTLAEILQLARHGKQILFVCRRGVDSRRAAAHSRAQLCSDQQLLSGLLQDQKAAVAENISDMLGGLCAWRNVVDSSFPII